MTTPIPSEGTRFSEAFKLEYPQSVGVFNSYEVAQRVVGYLSGKEFPIENICIVGTELKSVERVLGRRTWRTVLGKGVQSGISTGLMITLLMWIFSPETNFLLLTAAAIAIGIAIGVGMQAISYLVARGKRDFTSVSTTVATRYEVLCEHKHVIKAREIVAELPEVRQAAFTPYPPTFYAGAAPQAQQPVSPQAPYPVVQQPGAYPQAPYPTQVASPTAQQAGAYPVAQPSGGTYPQAPYPTTQQVPQQPSQQTDNPS